MTRCPVITHSECRLRPLVVEDAATWFAYASKPQVMKYMSSGAKDVNELGSRIEAANSKLSVPVFYGITLISDGDLIGTVGFHTISERNLTAEITYDLNPSCWGRGIATAACSATADWAFSNLGWVRIQATVMEANSKSIRVLQKCGFFLEGKVRNFRLMDGIPCDFLLYARIT
jgi:[ribosomal protein S5]-alanine N-acetyltransferase